MSLGQTVGLGTGRTAAKVVQAIADRVHAENLHLTFTCTSVATEELARSLGLTVVPIDQAGPIDIAIDGADEVDSSLDLVKGRGGALVRERLVERTAKRLVIVVDSEKRLADSIKTLPGVVDHGFFLGMASEVFVGNPDGTVTHLVRKAES